MKKLILVDGNSMIFKAYYGTAHTGNLMKGPCGTATNALRTMSNMIIRLTNEREPDKMLIAFDAGKKTFRHDKIDGYKAGRSKTPIELVEQFPLVKEFLKHFGVAQYELENYEADDIIATMATLASAKDYKVEIFSSDKDLLQLVDKNTTVFLTNKGVSNLDEVNNDNFFEKYSIWPNQVKDLKGLMGDTSDNLSGIPGVGEKTAIKLLTKHKNLETLFKNLDSTKGKLLERLTEHKDHALLCKEVATLHCEIPMTIKLNDIKFNPKSMNVEGMTHFLQKYAVNSLLKKFDLKTTENTAIDVEVVKDIPSSFEMTKTSLNVEVYDENYNMSTVLGLSISNGVKSIYIDKGSFSKAVKLKNFLLSETPKIVFDTSKTINSLKREGFILNGIKFDTKLASYIIDHKITPEMFRIEQFFTEGRTIESDDEVYGKGAKKALPLTSALAKNSILKSEWLFQYHVKFKELLENSGQESLYFDIELPLAFVLSEMEQNGVLINKKVLKSLEISTKQKIELLEQEIFRLAGEEFNVSSPSQLGVILFEKLKLDGKSKQNGKYSTANDILVPLLEKHEIIPNVILHRKYSKLLSTYILGVEEFIQEDGKVHTIYNQTLTQTGRLSSKFPNLQNISIKNVIQKEVRKSFVAAEGNILAAFDYSQIELRVLAHIAKSQHLIEAFRNDADIHKETASKVFKLSPELINTAQRNKAKAVNFGIVYGISDFGLAKQLSIPIWESKQIITSYKEAYPEIEVFRADCIKQALDFGYVTTMLGRKRFIPELSSSSHMQRNFGERAATNAPIQGSASDIIKIAMVNIDKKLKTTDLNVKLIMQIHDELVFEIQEDSLSSAKEIIMNEMTNALKLSVPLKVHYGVGKDLFSIK